MAGPNFDVGFDFSNESGLKTGDDLNDLVEKAKFSASSAALDQTTLTDDGAGKAKIKDGGVGTTQLADDAVTTDKLADDAVTNDKILDGTIEAAKLSSDAQDQLTRDYIQIRDKKTAGTHAGTATSGSWFTRDLNEEVTDAGGHASIASNQITLAAGTYEVRIHVPATRVNNHRARLRDITNSSTLLISTTIRSDSGGDVSAPVFIFGEITLASSTVLEVQQRVEDTKASDGQGRATDLGEPEVYTVVELWKTS